MLTLVLIAALAAVAVLGGTVARPPRARPVAQGLPPVVQPTGRLESAFRSARQASVRIDALCRGGAVADGPIGIGTGFFIAPDGLVLTAYHVVDPAEEGAPCPVRYVAITPGRSRYRLTLVGFDAYHDLAVLKADVKRSVPYVPLAKTLPRPGTKVVAVGDSRGQFLQPRAGEVTRLGVRPVRPGFASETMQLTNSLAPGDSGGPVVDAAGQAVGVVSYISFDPGGATGAARFVPRFLRGVPVPEGYASYAVPVTRHGALLSRLEAAERRDVPVIGFSWRRGYDYVPATSDRYLGPRPGVVVWQVQPGGPAAEAGLRGYVPAGSPGPDGSLTQAPRADVIIALDGTPTPTFYDLMALVRKKRIGERVTLSVERGNTIVKVPLRLGAQRSVFAPR